MSTIYTLPPVSTPASSRSDEPPTPAPSMRDQIEAGLLGTKEVTVPGEREEDKKWAYKRSVPTVVLYDEQGLRLYDEITAHASEYYLFEDELNLLKNHGDEIARSMGFPGKVSQEEDEESRQESDFDFESTNDEVPDRRWKPARWGDMAVGKFNGGVNGEEGLGNGGGTGETGWDIVELGAGALRKTAHLLTALSSALPSSPDDSTSDTASITYHALDLSYPELDRVLGEMDESFGHALKGKVDCVGLHGDYEAGLQLIREGKLGSLRDSTDSAGLSDRASIVSSEEAGMAIPSVNTNRAKEESPLLSPESARIVTPRSDIAPLPDMTEGHADLACGDASIHHGGPGSWSPVSSDDFGSHPRMDAHKTQSYYGNPTSSAQNKTTGSARPLHFVFLGSSLGNFDRESAAPFLKSLPLKNGDTLLIGLDGRPAPGPEGRKKVEVAYNDPAGYTKAFEEHGWEVVRQELRLVDDKGVEFVGRYNEELGRHEAYYRSKEAHTIYLLNNDQEVKLEKDELLNIEWSYKYSYGEALELFQRADLRIVNTWKAPDSEYRLWLLERPSVRFKENTALSADEGKAIGRTHKGVPSWEEWLDLWKFWDHITLEMIPKEMLHKKPIDLRHICLFYLGHIPTFLDIHLTRMTKGAHTEPEYFKTIFERGIDPDVDDPTKCHDHSEVPMSEEDWPSLPEILAFRDRVRARLRGIYDQLSSSQTPLTRHTGRVLFMTFEHEAMHAETLLYMLAQSEETRPPTATATPRFNLLARRWNEDVQENKVLSFAEGLIELGHRDLEIEDKQYLDGQGWESHEFGWDNEHPVSSQRVKAFKVDSLPISNNDYLSYLKGSGKYPQLTKDTAPASWVQPEGGHNNGEWKVRSFYGPQSFEVAGKWPLMASKLELDDYAKWKGGRLPTEAELRILWQNESGPRTSGGECNTGVKNWHPIPPTNTYTDNAGKVIHGHNGGVWEWTNTPFDGYEGFVPSVIYPGYSGDFFDGKHFVVLGGSWATVPSIAARRSFRNWYQSNYRFSFVGGRVAYDDA
ncbi:hypothetical protein I317_07367 [Kwoniella heveanensis CBS 569]|nr:hypothetical protein I317_07367 [Kwoniella heveanensis CBS 569]